MRSDAVEFHPGNRREEIALKNADVAGSVEQAVEFGVAHRAVRDVDGGDLSGKLGGDQSGITGAATDFQEAAARGLGEMIDEAAG